MKQFTMETLNAIATKAQEMVESFKMADYDAEYNYFYNGWYCREDDDEFNFFVGRVSFKDMTEWDSLRKWAEKMLDTELSLDVLPYVDCGEMEGMKVVIRREHPLKAKNLTYDAFKKEVVEVAEKAECLYEVRNAGAVYTATFKTDNFGGVFANIMYNPSTSLITEVFNGKEYDNFVDFAKDVREASRDLRAKRTFESLQENLKEFA